MDERIDIGRHRMARVLALIGAAVLAAITLWCAGQAWPMNGHDPAAMTTSAFLGLAGVASARLAVACSMAAHQLHAELKDAEVGKRSGTITRPHHPRRASRRRTASLFLALATVTGPAAAAAGATPLTHTVTTAQIPSTSSGDALDARGLAVPGFEESHDASDVASPDFSTGTAPPSAGEGDDDARTPDESASASATDECALPAPGWTPPPAKVATDHCHLLLGNGTDHATTASHVVLRGETLWGIASAHLPQHSSAEQVAAALPSWLEANPQLTSHPDLLHPGDVLAIPTHFTTGATR